MRRKIKQIRGFLAILSKNSRVSALPGKTERRTVPVPFPKMKNAALSISITISYFLSWKDNAFLLHVFVVVQILRSWTVYVLWVPDHWWRNFEIHSFKFQNNQLISIWYIQRSSLKAFSQFSTDLIFFQGLECLWFHSYDSQTLNFVHFFVPFFSKSYGLHCGFGFD